MCLQIDTALMLSTETQSLANQRLDIDVKSLCSSEVWIDTVFVQYYLGHTLFNQLII